MMSLYVHIYLVNKYILFLVAILLVQYGVLLCVSVCQYERV